MGVDLKIQMSPADVGHLPGTLTFPKALIMLSQNLKFWAKWIISTEKQFQSKVENHISSLWSKDPDAIDSAYSKGTFGKLSWYNSLPTVYPPKDFTLSEFMACWPEYKWGCSAMQDARILAEILQIKDYEGFSKDAEKVADSIRKEIDKHNGNLRYEWMFMLWTVHREKIRQRCKDDVIRSQLRQSQIA